MDVVERFLAQVERHPDHPAVVERDRVLSYGGFAARAWALAARLARLGPHPRVAIALPQSADSYVAMIATLLAGGYYLPCNRGSVAAKTARAIALFRPDVVLGLPEDSAALALPPGLTVWPVAGDAAPPLSAPRPAHRLAYVIFTSGSTGDPKGVMIPRPALGHYVDWALAAMAPGPGDRWSQHPNIAFDLSVLDIHGALCSGACLYPVQGELDRMLPARFIASQGLTIWNSVPSVVDLMAKAGDLKPGALPSLRLLTFCGEPLYPAQAELLLRAAPQARIQNTYGPTECTVSCTAVSFGLAELAAVSDGTIALGPPIPGMALHLVATEQGHELAISGPQLADGYWEDAERTARAFRPLLVDGQERRAYFTGDLVRTKGGQLFFDSRSDTQVKIRGHRLELDEVNAALRGLGIAAAATILVDGRLHSFISGPDLADEASLRARLESVLDPHAIPSRIHPLAELPRNANDKIDLAALESLLPEA